MNTQNIVYVVILCDACALYLFYTLEQLVNSVLRFIDQKNELHHDFKVKGMSWLAQAAWYCC